MRILITGGCGFIGSNLAVELGQQGHQVVCFDNLTRRGSEILARRVEAAGCQVVRGDVRSMEDLERITGADVLIECSAEPSVLVGSEGADARYLLNVNLGGALNCFEWARRCGSGVIFLSTSRVYPIVPLAAANYEETETRFEFADAFSGVSANGVTVDCPLRGARSLYGASKLAAEHVLVEYAEAYDLPAIINRCGVVAGPWQLGKVDQGVFTFWLARHVFEQPLSYIGFGGKGKQVRDLLHVQDLCDLIVRQVDGIGEFRGECFNVGGGKSGSLSLLETTAICRDLTGGTLEIGAVEENRPFDLPWYITDNGNTGDVFDWRPRRSPREVFEDTYEWMIAHKSVFAEILGV